MGDHRSVMRSVTLASKPGGPVSTPSPHLRSARRAPGYQPPRDLAFFLAPTERLWHGIEDRDAKAEQDWGIATP
jgi:hypothetical protein